MGQAVVEPGQLRLGGCQLGGQLLVFADQALKPLVRKEEVPGLRGVFAGGGGQGFGQLADLAGEAFAGRAHAGEPSGELLHLAGDFSELPVQAFGLLLGGVPGLGNGLQGGFHFLHLAVQLGALLGHFTQAAGQFRDPGQGVFLFGLLVCQGLAGFIQGLVQGLVFAQRLVFQIRLRLQSGGGLVQILGQGRVFRQGVFLRGGLGRQVRGQVLFVRLQTAVLCGDVVQLLGDGLAVLLFLVQQITQHSRANQADDQSNAQNDQTIFHDSTHPFAGYINILIITLHYHDQLYPIPTAYLLRSI